MTMTLPSLPDRDLIHARLPLIFPEGTPNRNYCVRDISVRTIYVMLYIGAVEGSDIWLRPDQVTRMTDEQADMTDDEAREAWRTTSMKRAKTEIPGRWYAVNTRESIRDETLRDGLVPTGAVVIRQDVPTTSSKPRYALARDFAALFADSLLDLEAVVEIDAWRSDNLNPGALARVQMLRRGAASGGGGVLITFPSGETRRMAFGPSAQISKAVIEEFAPRFLRHPGVVALSDSERKMIARDDELCRAIGLEVEADRNLPDIILVDLGPMSPVLVFVEVVATDGPVSETRKRALTDLAAQAGFVPDDLVFVTAYRDRAASAFRKTVAALAAGSHAWFTSEPDMLMSLGTGPDLTVGRR